MELTETTLPDYLRNRGLLDGRRVSRVQVSLRRSFCATVGLEDGTQWFVKQARRAADDLPLSEVTNEAATLRWAQRSAAAAALRPLMPELYLFDEGAQVLVTEYLGAYRPLLDHYRRRSLFSHRVARALAVRLARCHAIRADEDHHSPAGDGPRRIEAAPFITWEHPTPAQIAAQPTGFIEFVEIVQSTDGLSAALRSLRDAWRPRRLIHADAKSDNIMFRPRSDAGAADLRLIDWELAGWGDPEWDAGSVIGDYLYHWLGSMVPTADGSLNDWLGGARVPFVRVQHAMREFWTAYARGRARGDDNPDVARAIGYAGVFLMERALANVMVFGTLSSTALCFLQVAKQLIREPEISARRLLS